MAANNVTYFDAALSGALSGVCRGGIVDVTAGDYTATIAACVAFATEVDSQIPLDGSVSVPRANLLGAICQAVVSSQLVNSTAATYLPQAAAIAVLFNAAKTSLQ